MTTTTEGETLRELLTMTDRERARLFWMAAGLTLTTRHDTLGGKVRHAARLARLAVLCELRAGPPAGHQLAAWALLIGAGVAVLSGGPWAAPVATFLAVGSMGCWNWRGWIDTARQLGEGWPRR